MLLDRRTIKICDEFAKNVESPFRENKNPESIFPEDFFHVFVFVYYSI